MAIQYSKAVLGIMKKGRDEVEANEDRLRTIKWQYPERIPISVDFLPSAWMKHRENLDVIVQRHPQIFGFRPQPSESQSAAEQARWAYATMTDHLTPKRRSWLMSRVPSKDTTPELIVRRSVRAMGYRYRLHRSDLAGKPDIVLPRPKKIIFVHGCFWHRHKGCRKASVPKSRTAFWLDKFEKNVERDARNVGILKKCGWKILVVWQCQSTDRGKLEKRLRRFLDEPQ